MIGPSLPPNSRPREVPPEIDRWNWGAFWFTCFWGIFNRTPIALLAILPGFNVIMPLCSVREEADGPGATGIGTASSISNGFNTNGQYGDALASFVA